MKHSTIYIEEPNGAGQSGATDQWRTAVSLHSHTLHSRETLAFIGSLAERSKLCRLALDRGKKQYRNAHGVALDLDRGWWTPPLAPFDAWTLERQHIEQKLGKKALVSLTDHDDIEAPLSLRVLEPCKELPVSVEWTVPYGPTFFHLGIHNMEPGRARATMSRLEKFTASGRTIDLEEILSALAANPAALIVFNHPCWDEKAIGQSAHVEWAGQFVRHYGAYIHALELNGLRPWKENREVIRMGFAWNKPVISGGDRHAVEPNTILDLTDAETFSEYVEQVRSGRTTVWVTRQYGESFQYRVVQSLQEILAYREDHGRGWKRWSDRVFFRCEDEVVRPLSALFHQNTPVPVMLLTAGVALSRHRGLARTFRLAFPRRQEVAL